MSFLVIQPLTSKLSMAKKSLSESMLPTWDRQVERLREFESRSSDAFFFVYTQSYKEAQFHQPPPWKSGILQQNYALRQKKI